MIVGRIMIEGLPPVDALLGAILLSNRCGCYRLFEHEGQPIPKARAQVIRDGRSFTPPRTVRAERDLAYTFIQACAGDRFDSQSDFALACIFYRTGKLRADADNLLKLVMDAGQKAGVWIDDRQVTRTAAIVVPDCLWPRTLIGYCTVHGGTLGDADTKATGSVRASGSSGGEAAP